MAGQGLHQGILNLLVQRLLGSGQSPLPTPGPPTGFQSQSQGDIELLPDPEWQARIRALRQFTDAHPEYQKPHPEYYSKGRR